MTSSDISSMDCQVDDQMLLCERWCYEVLGVSKEIVELYYEMHKAWKF